MITTAFIYIVVGIVIAAASIAATWHGQSIKEPTAKTVYDQWQSRAEQDFWFAPLTVALMIFLWPVFLLSAIKKNRS